VIRVTGYEIKASGIVGHSSYAFGDALDAAVVGEVAEFSLVARAPTYQTDFGLLFNVTGETSVDCYR
jgi:hypothetical protein